MKKTAILFLFISLVTALHSQSHLMLRVTKQHAGVVSREGTFISIDEARSRRKIDRSNPGTCGHLTLLVSDRMELYSPMDSVNLQLQLPGNFVFSFENAELLDSMPYVALVADSSSADHFLERVSHVRKREWEVYRMVIRDKHTGEGWCMYLRFQNDLFTIDLPDKSNRETMKFKSISPSIPIIHLGNIDYSRYQVGPGISFNVGLMPRKPYLRLLSDIIGPVSLEWMFKPIADFHDALAIQSAAVGVFFNSFYGLFHWGIAWYTLSYSRAEAYIGINFAPALQLLNGRKSWRYRW